MLEHLGLPFGYQYSKQTGGNTAGKVTYDDYNPSMDVKMFSHTFNTKTQQLLNIRDTDVSSKKNNSKQKTRKNKK
tara:strand:+ start:662 stop:886 length:225 start_codon:yes stop_codon:yes gene_type:complete